MNQVSEQFRRANQTGMQTLETVAAVAFDAMEKLAALNLGMVRGVLEQRETASRKLVAATRPETLVSLQAGVFLESSRQAMDYSQRVMEIGNAARDGLSKLVTEQIPGSPRRN
ncbi:MAG: phasin family protein [Rhodocyclales bacterium]|nr:phasin family protein [Rhodocyclales bacterium]